MLRHQLEIEEELGALSALREEAEGNEERAEGIDAQITVIRDRMTRQELEDLYSEDEPVFDAAIIAYRWLCEDGDAASQSWAQEELEQAA